MNIVEIKDPRLNPNSKIERRWSLAEEIDKLVTSLKRGRIGPESHPRVIDLASGDAPIAKRLTELGWSSQNITCVDIHKPTESLVEGVSWKFFDLSVLGNCLLYGGYDSIQKEDRGTLERMRGKYDLVTMFFAFLGEEAEKEVCAFFCKKGGKIIRR